MRLLVIEDDPDIGDVLRRGLAAEGCRVDLADNGPDGLWRASEGEHDAIVLDLLLPGMNGYEVCRRLRADGITTPVLVLTAKDGELDQIDLLELGADAFLTKPVTSSLLVAHLRALVRRGGVIVERIHTVGALSYDEDRQRCTLDGAPIRLTGREHDVILELFRTTGYCGREQLLRAVWGFDFDGDPGIIDVYIRRLRAKIGADRLENRRGLGYRLVAM